MLRRFLMLTLILVSALHAQPSAQSRDADDVTATLVQMWAAIEAGDVARYATFVHPDFTQFGETDEYLSEGKAAEVRGMTAYLQRAVGVHTDMHHAQVTDRKSTRLNSSHLRLSRMPSSA